LQYTPLGYLAPTFCKERYSPSYTLPGYTVGMAPDPSRGYAATKDQLITRLNRIEGQVRGIKAMVDDDRYCIDVLTQISAVQAALDKVALGLLDDHVNHCVANAKGDDKVQKTHELMASVGRLLKRG